MHSKKGFLFGDTMNNKHLLLKIFAVFFLLFFLSCSADNDLPLVIPFTLENNRIILYAVINGQAGRFAFDSGANVSVANIRRFPGIFPIDLGRSVIDGVLRIVPVYRVNSIQFGDVVVNARSRLITRDDVVTRAIENENIDGILGINVFEGFWVELSFSRNKIILHKEIPANFISASSVPLIANGTIPMLYLPINIDNREFLMLIDTGAPHALYFPNNIINFIDDEDKTKIVSLLEAGDFYLVRTNRINILDVVYYNKLIMNNSYIVERTRNPSHAYKGIIGIDFLRHYDFLLDYRDLRKGRTTGMYYIPITFPEERCYGFFSFLSGMPKFGIITFCVPCFNRNGRLRITSLLTDSIAYALGLRLGSEITYINGKPVSDFLLEDLRDPFFFDKITEFSVFNRESNEYIAFYLNH